MDLEIIERMGLGDPLMQKPHPENRAAPGSLLRIELRGEAAGITSYCSSPPRRDFAYRNSLVFVAMTQSWEPEVQYGVKVKDARNVPRR